MKSTLEVLHIIVLRGRNRLGDAYPSFWVKGWKNPPRGRSTDTQISNWKPNTDISFTFHSPRVISSSEHFLHWTIYIRQLFFTPIELECDHISWQLSDDDQWSLASSDDMSVSVNPLKAKEKTAPNRDPIMSHTQTKHGHKLTGITYTHKQVHKFPFCNCKATEIQMLWSQSEQWYDVQSLMWPGERPQSAGNEQTPINVLTSEANFHDNG
jgi:hypothetical protein